MEHLKDYPENNPERNESKEVWQGVITTGESVEDAHDRLEEIWVSFEQALGRAGWGEGSEISMGIAFREAVINAVYHGDYGVGAASGSLPEQAEALVRQLREKGTPFVSKEVHVSWEIDSQAVSAVIADQGQGFDVDSVPDPLKSENIRKESGRGLLLMKLAYPGMDGVKISSGPNGTVVRLARRKESV